MCESFSLFQTFFPSVFITEKLNVLDEVLRGSPVSTVTAKDAAAAQIRWAGQSLP